jgi:small ligand-binding sensory domain FIST
MTERIPQARAAVASDSQWRPALVEVLAETHIPEPDVALLFVSAELVPELPEIAHETWRQTGAPVLIGCSGIGVIGPSRELERMPAIALLQLALPDGELGAVRFSPELIERANTDQHPDPEWVHKNIGLRPEQVNGWLVFASPAGVNGDAFAATLGRAYPGRAILGGFASPGPRDRETRVFVNGEILADGAVGLAIGGSYDLIPLVSQGCEPIGEPWTVTGVQDHWIETISNRPALELIIETLNNLPELIRIRAQRNLLLGFAINEYQHHFERGDFLVRNIAGIDRRRGAIAVGNSPRLGQTIQFQMRDATTADLDLALMLSDLKRDLSEEQPVAALLCSCNGRGVNLFGASHHDAAAINAAFPDLPLAGLFCAGEIGPIGPETYLHGFTAALGLIVKR